MPFGCMPGAPVHKLVPWLDVLDAHMAVVPGASPSQPTTPCTFATAKSSAGCSKREASGISATQACGPSVQAVEGLESCRATPAEEDTAAVVDCREPRPPV
eukprot:scaffold87348_cov32-Tisochrysis_lutea.AAC.1